MTMGIQIWFVTCSLTIYFFFTYFDIYRVSVTCSIFKSWQSLHYSWTPLLWPSDPVYQYFLFAQSCFNKNVIFKDVHIRTCLISTIKYFVFYLILFVCVSEWFLCFKLTILLIENLMFDYHNLIQLHCISRAIPYFK